MSTNPSHLRCNCDFCIQAESDGINLDLAREQLARALGQTWLYRSALEDEQAAREYPVGREGWVTVRERADESRKRALATEPHENPLEAQLKAALDALERLREIQEEKGHAQEHEIYQYEKREEDLIAGALLSAGRR